jgi:RimJ/RimL family protein N-acetyltransferase
VGIASTNGQPSAASAAYAERVVQAFLSLKDTTAVRDLEARSLPLADGRGLLVPVCELHATDAHLIDTVARWRERNMAAYPTQFPVTTAGTAVWLQDRVLAVRDRVMFLVVEPGGTPVGHVGLSEALNDERAVRLDNIMRGEDRGPPGTMSASLTALIRWAQEMLAPRTIWLKVFSDNDRAIQFFRRAGFREHGLQPLRALVHGDRLEYVPADGLTLGADRYHLHMVLGQAGAG